MKKIVWVILQWILIGLSLPALKNIFDWATNPTTGILSSMGVDEWTIAFIGTFPWLLPLAWFVGTIMYLISPSIPEQPSYTVPDRSLYKKPKEKKPKIIRL